MLETGAWTSRIWTFRRGAEVFPAILERLRGTPVRAEEFVQSVPAHVLNVRIGGKWSAQDHLGHLADLHPLDDMRLSQLLEGAGVLTTADRTMRSRNVPAITTRSRQISLDDFARLEWTHDSSSS